MKIDIAGLKISPLTKQELLDALKNRFKASEKTWITTIYSEFLCFGLKNPKVMQTLNQADVAIADGVGVFWAEKFLNYPLTAQNYWLKILQAYRQAATALFFLPFAGRGGGGEQLKEKIPGSELIWDIARLAAENNLSMYLLGGFNDTPNLVAKKFKIKNSKLKIAGWSDKNPDDPSIPDDIKKASPDILLVAYGPIKQERWIFENRDKLPSVKLFMGVGGAFDYLAGKRPAPPKFVRRSGLEWLWRLLTQPHRFKRIYNATVGLVDLLVHYKVFSSMPSRRNVASIILNSKKQILIFQRSRYDQRWEIKQPSEYENYWQFTQGGIDEDENLLAAAKREIQEETGIRSLKFLGFSKHINTYDFRNAIRPFYTNRIYQFRGQTQKITYFEFTGNDNEIKLDQNELVGWKWVNINELKNAIHPERLSLTEIVAADLKEMAEKGMI